MPFKFIGAQPPWTSPGLCLQLRGAGWGRLEGVAAGEGSRGSQAFYYLQVSRTPRPCSTPWRPERREEGGGGAGDTGIPPGSSRRRRGGGDRPCVPRCTGCPAARIAPRASRVGLERLCPGSRERLGSECWSPHFCVWLPGELGIGSEALRVSAELSRFLPRSLSAGGSRLREERGLGERNRHRVTD